MTLQQLRYVTAVADCGSMNEAAKTLFVSQPGLSGAIKELEEETGIEIFKRTNKGVLPTPEGEEFLGYARQLLNQYDKGAQKVQRVHAALFLCSKGICRAREAVRDG